MRSTACAARPSCWEAMCGAASLVLDDFGNIGRAYREVDEAEADRATSFAASSKANTNNPIRIVCFNTSEGWARDVTEDIALEIKEWSERKGELLSPGLRDFIDYQFELQIGLSVTLVQPDQEACHGRRP